MLNSAPYYWITCDDCGANGQEGSDYAAWKDADTAFIEPDAAGWIEQDGKHYCPECAVKREEES